jgi:uncharacterized protein involved in exopolysaccharide biosynthesis
MNGFHEAHAEPEPDAGPDLRVLLVRGVSRSLPWVILIVFLGIAAGFAIGQIQPNTFVSNAKLLLRVGAREQMSSESLFGPDEGQRATAPTMVDELQMLADVGVYEQVARKIGPREILAVADPTRDDGPLTFPLVRVLHRVQALGFRWISPPHDCPAGDCPSCLRAATKSLVKDTKITNEPGSNVILVAYTSTSPEKARAVAAALVDAFIERHRDQFSIQSLVDRNRDKVERAKKARDEAADVYIRDVDQFGGDDIDVQGPPLLAEINGVEKDLFAARVRREEIVRQRASLSERLTGIPSEVEILRPAIMVPNEEYETQLALKRTLLAQKQSVPFEIRPKEEMRQREREFDEQIAKIDERLKSIPRAVKQTTERRENVGHSTMATRIEDLDEEEQALVVKIDLLEKRLEEKQARMSEIRTKGLVAALHRKDLAAAKDVEENRYKHLLERFSVLESLASIDLNENANLTVLQQPTLDLEPVGPKQVGLVLKGLIVGMLAAAAFAMLRQRFDGKLRYPETWERARGVPVLGLVPELPSLRMPKRKSMARWS